jgi:F-type H+-transporting ATPase subunit gamma
MPSLKDIRRRADSVKKTQQITRAMRMVAAAKMRRAQDAIFAARPYADRMRRTLAEVAGSRPDAEHPLLIARDPVQRIEFVVVTSDRGLCGGFNSNVLKLAQAAVAERDRGPAGTFVTPVGRKAMEHFRRHRAASITQSFESLGRIEYGHAARIARHLIGRYTAGEVDEVVLVYSEFVSAMTQKPRSVRLLPVSPQSDEVDAVSASAGLPYEIEPSAPRLLQVLVPKALEVAVFRALLENQAGEHAARMAAMESATRNTEELIESLTLQYNRARQASITKELVEIVSGAEAL